MSFLGDGAEAAFRTRKPCDHGTLLSELCGACKALNVGRAVEYLEAKRVAQGRFAFAGNAEIHAQHRDVRGTRYFLTDDTALALLGAFLRMTDAGQSDVELYGWFEGWWDEQRAEIVALPTWWTPERPIAFAYARVIGGKLTFNPRDVASTWRMNEQTPAGNLVPVTIDLQSGAEVPVTPQLQRAILAMPLAELDVADDEAGPCSERLREIAATVRNVVDAFVGYRKFEDL